MILTLGFTNNSGVCEIVILDLGEIVQKPLLSQYVNYFRKHLTSKLIARKAGTTRSPYKRE